MRMVGKLICGVMCFAATVASATVTTNLDSYVEYIQSSGTQYINPGVIITSTMAVEVDAGMLWDPMVTPGLFSAAFVCLQPSGVSWCR